MTTTAAATASYLAALRALVSDASPGPWHADGPYVWRGPNQRSAVGNQDAVFIAAARTALPSLLDEVDRLTNEVDRLMGVIDEHREALLSDADRLVAALDATPEHRTRMERWRTAAAERLRGQSPE